MQTDRLMDERTDRHDESNSRFSHLNADKTHQNHRMCRTNIQINMHSRFCRATSLANKGAEEKPK